VNPLLIEILKEKGYEDYILFDEKNCCINMSRKILKAISYLCKEYKSKSVLWYRNFLVKKFHPEEKQNISSRITRINEENLNKRFYWTYLSDAVTKKNIRYEDFKNQKHKIKTYYSEYSQLDHELGTKTRLYNFNTSDYHSIKQKEMNRVYGETISYMNSDKKIVIEHEKDSEWNYKKALNRLSNPVFLKKIKRTITQAISQKKIITMEEHKKEMKSLQNKYGLNDTLDIEKEELIQKMNLDIQLIEKEEETINMIEKTIFK